ncbi:MAG: ribbon-helix-helix protein, CopG family [Pseudomonadota bacterium]|nr:ribbon-helix-helix protein, CopG family [Pseudomonadota bacterium]
MEKPTIPENFAVPSALRAAVQAMADEEHRSAAEVIREAVERYLEQRRWQKIFAYGEERARMLNLSETDIPRLIAEYRRENH